MTEKGSSPEEQKLKIRRRLLKLGIYSVPVIATILTTEEAYAQIKYARKPGWPKIRKSGIS